MLSERLENYVIRTHQKLMDKKLYRKLYINAWTSTPFEWLRSKVLKRGRGFVAYLKELETDYIIIYGTDDEAAEIDRILVRCRGAGCRYFVDDMPRCEAFLGKPVKRTDELLLDMHREQMRIILASTDLKKMEHILDLGVDKSQIIEYRDLGGCKAGDVYDVTLGYSRVDDMPGFAVFGDPECSYKIVALGGSTTDPTWANVMSWPELLWNRLKEMGIDVVVYNGGMGAFTSTQELLKLIRDAIPLHPNMVISLSGTNDAEVNREYFVEGHPFVREYQKRMFEDLVHHDWLTNYNFGVPVKQVGYGLPNEKSFAQYWVDNMRMMHSLCEEFGISFYGFLQPRRNYGGYVMHVDEIYPCYADHIHHYHNSAEYSMRIRQWFEEAREEIKKLDYMTDLSFLFDEQKNIYMDFCHVYEKGNRQIADAILRKILNEIRQNQQKTGEDRA